MAGPIQTDIWSKSIAQSELHEASLSEEIKAVYGVSISAMKKSVALAAKEAVSVEKVTEAVLEAIERKTLQAYYLVGKNIRFTAWLVALLPVWWLDRLIAGGFRFKKGD